MTPQYAIQGDGSRWCWFSQPIRRIHTSHDFSAAMDELQQLSEQHPVSFAIDYEGSIAHAYQRSLPCHGLEAWVWESIEYLDTQQLIERLPQPAQHWEWELEMTYSDWRTRIETLQAYLRAGDCYQGNLSVRARGRCVESAGALFSALLQRQPSEFSALMPWRSGWALSLSPELLWRVDEGAIECQPMKGTIGLGETDEQSAQLASWLAQDTKNRAENLMILDLIRNDLGRIAQPGSVHVPESFSVRRYQTLQQMVSTVRAQLNRTRFSDWCAALMPYGSITGAPKKRAIEILEQLEISPRGLYTGSCGYLFKGHSVANVAIRTATLIDQNLEFGVGGGITLDSEAQDEWDEVLLKTRFIAAP